MSNAHGRIKSPLVTGQYATVKNCASGYIKRVEWVACLALAVFMPWQTSESASLNDTPSIIRVLTTGSPDFNPPYLPPGSPQYLEPLPRGNVALWTYMPWVPISSAHPTHYIVTDIWINYFDVWCGTNHPPGKPRLQLAAFRRAAQGSTDSRQLFLFQGTDAFVHENGVETAMRRFSYPQPILLPAGGVIDFTVLAPKTYGCAVWMGYSPVEAGNQLAWPPPPPRLKLIDPPKPPLSEVAAE